LDAADSGVARPFRWSNSIPIVATAFRNQAVDVTHSAWGLCAVTLPG